MQPTSLLLLVNTYSPYRNYCEEPRAVQRRQNFLVSWYHKAFVWLIPPSTLLTELVLKETQTHL